MLSEKQLAERGAVIALQELKAEILKLYTAYPGLLMAERLEKRKQTMLDKYGTLNPHEAKERAQAKAAKGKDKVNAAGPKKSHHKKKVAAPAIEVPQAETEPFTTLPVAEAAGDAVGGAEVESIELVEGENETESVGAQA